MSQFQMPNPLQGGGTQPGTGQPFGVPGSAPIGQGGFPPPPGSGAKPGRGAPGMVPGMTPPPGMASAAPGMTPMTNAMGSAMGGAIGAAGPRPGFNLAQGALNDPNRMIPGKACEGKPALLKAYEFLYQIMRHADEVNASDIFIAPGFPPALKINGVLTPLSDEKLDNETAQNIVYSTMTPNNIREFTEKLELNYAHRATDFVRFRVNAYHEQNRVGMVMRKINTKIATLDDLKLPPILKKLALERRSLIIVVGATGSGKSTTLAAMVDYRNKRMANHIITIEDPIEFVHQHQKSIITQREVGIDTASWHEALKSAMREAPDVVIIGEVRDQLSMSHAMELSQTGHLCFCTLHATNANQAIERVINFYDEDRHPLVFMDLSMNLQAIISQRLVRKKDGTGRTVAMDIMLAVPAIKDFILKGQIDMLKDTMNRSEDEGMQTFDQHLFQLYCEDVISFDEAMANADSQNNLRLQIQLWEEGQNSEKRQSRSDKLDLL